MAFLLRKIAGTDGPWKQLSQDANSPATDEPTPGEYVYARVEDRFAKVQRASAPGGAPTDLGATFWLSATWAAKDRAASDPITDWQDISGNLHAPKLQSYANGGDFSWPILRTNPRPGADFDVSEGSVIMRLPEGVFPTGSDPYAICALFTYRASVRRQILVSVGQGASGSEIQISFRDGAVTHGWGSNEGPATTEGFLRDGDRILLICQYSADTGRQIFIETEKAASDAPSAARNGIYDDDDRLIGAGRKTTENTRLFDGILEDIFVVDRALTSSERSAVLSWAESDRGYVVPSPLTQVSDIPNLRLHLRAEDVTAGDGSGVASWPDQSAQGNDATQSDAGQQPTFKASGADGFPAVDFDGTASRMDLPDGTVTAGDVSHTFFMVERKRSTENGYALRAGDRAAGTTMGFYMTDSVTVWDGSSVSSGPTITLNEQHMHAARLDATSGNAEMQEDGDLRTVSVATLKTDETGNMLGARPDDSGGFARFLDAEVAEIMYFDRALSGREFRFVQDYLNDKYGL